MEPTQQMSRSEHKQFTLSEQFKRLRKWPQQLLLSAAMFCAPMLAQATTSEFSGFYVPYQRVQSQYTCLDQQLMQAVFGIPLGSLVNGVLSPTRTLHQQSGGNNYQNINLLSPGSARIIPQLNFDRYISGVFDYSFTLDLAQLNTLHGNSASGRQKTHNLAKLAVISLVKTAELTHSAGGFRVWIRFDNLPSGAGLSSPAYVGSTDWPNWPYTSGSSLYQTYHSQMINADC